jgi:toxin FitB
LTVVSRYLLDTNVVSEMRKVRPDLAVSTFMSAADADSLFVSVLTLGELRKGVSAKRRTDPIAAKRLEMWANETERHYAQRLLEIDAAIAKLWGELSAGKSLAVIDTLLAATAIVHDLILVTRNTRDVEFTGVPILNPWQTQ